MDLIRIKNIVKRMVSENFRTNADLNMLMQFFGLVHEQYQQTMRIPDFLVESVLTNRVEMSNIRPGSNCSIISSDSGASSMVFSFLDENSSSKRSLDQSESDQMRAKTMRFGTIILDDRDHSNIRPSTSFVLETPAKAPTQPSQLSQPMSTSSSSSSQTPTISDSLKREPTDTLSGNADNFDLLFSQIQIIKSEIISNLKEPNSFVNIKEAWSFLCDLTQNVDNCVMFASSFDGIDLVLEQINCLNKKLYADIYISMLGLLGNVSMFKQTRNFLFVKELIKTLKEFVDDEDETMSYLASRCLVNLIASGEWLSNDIQKEHTYATIEAVLSLMLQRINSKRKLDLFNFSLNPILALLDSNYDICVRWSCWTLANLTSNEPNKYVPLIKNTVSFNILNSIANSKRGINSQATKELARQILKNVNNFKANPNQKSK